ncbi:type II toxin-antitoxin system HicB family antitoxin [Alphaproteobacteria bacterium LSUCC0719]
MKRFIALVHQEGDSAFGIEFPDVPRCFSAADDADDIIAMASEALSLHLEGQDIPMARSLDELRIECADDLANGAYLVAIPLVNLSGRSVKANITMSAGLLDAVDQTAKERGLTRSAFLSELARREINA